MKTVELQASLRSESGKASTKKVRKRKAIPAVVYGRKIKPVSIEVDGKMFESVIHTSAGENVVIDLKVKGAKPVHESVIIKEIQHDPVTDRIDHIDFNVISLTEKIKVKVRLSVKGEAPGSKTGGVLDVVHHEIEVECLPTQIPDKIEVDISKLEIGDAIHIREIQFPVGVLPQLSTDEVVVAVHAPKAVVEEKPVEEAAGKEPEVIAKGKEEGKGEEAPAEAGKEKAEKTEKAGAKPEGKS